MEILLLFVLVVFGWLTGSIFQSKNRKFFEGFIVGVFIGPIGVLVALCLAPVSPKVYEEIKEYKKQIGDINFGVKLRKKFKGK